MQYVYSRVWEQVKWQRHKSEGTGCATHQEEKKSQWARQKEGEGQRGRHPITSDSRSRTFIGIAGTTSTRQRGTESTMGNDNGI